MERRLVRRNLALAAGTLVLMLPGVTACGFNYATDRDYTPAAGVNDQSGTVDVLNAAIVSAADGSGTFVATLSNGDRTQAISLDSLGFGSDATTAAASFSPIEVPPARSVNLADGQGIKVSGAFTRGAFLEVTLGFSDQSKITMRVPVVAAEGQWDGLDNGTGTPSPTASASPSS